LIQPVLVFFAIDKLRHRSDPAPVAAGSRFLLIVELKQGDGVSYIKGAKTQ
jgi:hypothetical protein